MRRQASSITRSQQLHDKIRMQDILIILNDLDLAEKHRILFSVLRSVEVTMEEYGMTPPKYTEHRVSQVKQDMNPDYTPCRRCALHPKEPCYEDAMGKCYVCDIFKCKDGSDYIVSHDDGCSRGLLREEYVK